MYFLSNATHDTNIEDSYLLYDINNTWNETRDYYYNNIMKVISPFEKIHNLVSIKLCNIIYICVCVCVCVLLRFG